MTKPRRRTRKPKPEENARRLIQVLESNLATATSPELKQRLQRAIESLKQKTA
jgi:hypothetical protein